MTFTGKPIGPPERRLSSKFAWVYLPESTFPICNKSVKNIPVTQYCTMLLNTTNVHANQMFPLSVCFGKNKIYFLLPLQPKGNWFYQARNQLRTPGGEKGFLRRAQIFWTMSNIFKLYPTHFSKGREKFSRGNFFPLRLPGYGPGF